MAKSSKIIGREGLIKEAKKQNWGDLWPILLAFIIGRLYNRYKVKGSKKEIAERAKLFLSEVLNHIFFEGNRNWNTEEYSTFEDFFKSVIDSHLYNTIKKTKPGKGLTSEPQNESSALSAEDVIAFEELRKAAYGELVQLEATDEEMMVFECMADGIVKPRDIREELGIDERQFNNIWRTLKRKLIKVQEKLDNGYGV